MAIFLGLLLALSVLAGTVYSLHRYQKTRSLDNADRQSPLPPLSATPQLMIEIATAHDEQRPRRTTGTTWRTLYRQLKNSGEPEAAMAVCIENFPQRQAFELAARLVRAQIRELAAEQQAHKSELLQQLYLIACQDSFIHDRLDGVANLNRLQLQTLPSSAWMGLAMPYQEIGYEQLALLNKTDQRDIRTNWGAPLRHQSAKAYHQRHWHNLLGSL
ncbi:MAG: hypothetical protein RQ757_07385 [Pseudomonadales bacterium]|nr:hypothetical protein [Pseudomonadales bacterium]